MTPTSQEQLNDQQKESSLDMNHLVGPLSQEEVSSVLEVLWNPETDHIKELVKRIEASIKDADSNWQIFLQHLDQKTFVSVGACKREGIASLAKFTDSRKAAIQLKDYVHDFFYTRLSVLDQTYRDLQKQYNALKNKQSARSLPTTEMNKIFQQQAKIKALQAQLEATQPRINGLLNNFARMMENKLDQHKVLLYGKKYKGDRLFDKDNERDAKTKAEKGNRRDPENASKYLWGWPTPDKGKCGITDAQNKVDKETMKEALAARKWGGDKRTGIVEWTPAAQIVPSIDSDIDTLITAINELMTEIPMLKTNVEKLQSDWEK